MIAGAIAGSATVLITNPIWVINTRMTARSTDSPSSLPSPSAAQKTRKPSTLATLLSLFREEGPTALFAGVLPALVLVINPILQYTIFEQLKDALEKRRGRVLPRDAFFLGAIGKLLATSITYPYITIKSRMHVAKKEGPQDNMIGSLKRVVREEGWGGLYKGEFLHLINLGLNLRGCGTSRSRIYSTMRHTLIGFFLCPLSLPPLFHSSKIQIKRDHDTSIQRLIPSPSQSSRHRPQGNPKRNHRRLSLRLQRRSLRRQRASQAKGTQDAASEMSSVTVGGRGLFLEAL